MAANPRAKTVIVIAIPDLIFQLIGHRFTEGDLRAATLALIARSITPAALDG